MAGSGYSIHGERVSETGDASTATVLTLYDSGSADVRALGDAEVLHITDVMVVTETAGDVALYADTAAGGRYLLLTKSAAGVPIVMNYRMPFVCPPGVVPKFVGVASDRNFCTIQGYITEA